jgi:hypothetical protein
MKTGVNALLASGALGVIALHERQAAAGLIVSPPHAAAAAANAGLHASPLGRQPAPALSPVGLPFRAAQSG